MLWDGNADRKIGPNPGRCFEDATWMSHHVGRQRNRYKLIDIVRQVRTEPWLDCAPLPLAYATLTPAPPSHHPPPYRRHNASSVLTRFMEPLRLEPGEPQSSTVPRPAARLSCMVNVAPDATLLTACSQTTFAKLKTVATHLTSIMVSVYAARTT
jgi:hypothetical protein